MLAGALNKVTGLPVIHLEQHCWQPGWHALTRCSLDLPRLLCAWKRFGQTLKPLELATDTRTSRSKPPPGLVGQLLLPEPGVGHFNSRVTDLDLITISAHTARDGELGDLDAAGIAELHQNSVIVGADHKADERGVAGCHVYLLQYGRVSDPRDYEPQK